MSKSLIDSILSRATLDISSLIRLVWCITVLTETTWTSASLLPRETVILSLRKMQNPRSYSGTTFQGDLLYLATSYSAQGHQQPNTYVRSGKTFTWYSMFLRVIVHHQFCLKMNCSNLSQWEFGALKGTRLQIMCSVTQWMIFPSMSLLLNLLNFIHTRNKTTALPAPIFMKPGNDQQYDV